MTSAGPATLRGLCARPTSDESFFHPAIPSSISELFTFAYKILELRLVASNLLAWLIAVSGSYLMICSELRSGRLKIGQFTDDCSSRCCSETISARNCAS